MPTSSQSVCRLCTNVVPTLFERCVDVVRTLCAPTVCQVLIVCQCCVDVVQSADVVCANGVLMVKSQGLIVCQCCVDVVRSTHEMLDVCRRCADVS